MGHSRHRHDPLKTGGLLVNLAHADVILADIRGHIVKHSLKSLHFFNWHGFGNRKDKRNKKDKSKNQHHISQEERS